MPLKVDKINISETKYDRRRKLSQEDRKTIKMLHRRGLSIRAIAQTFFVSRRSIQYIIYPERLVRHKMLKKEAGWKKYYNKDKHAKAMSRTRDYKKRLLYNKKIGDEK